MRRALLVLCLALSSCGDPVAVGNRAAGDVGNLAADTLTAAARPVRIGELGPNFAACSAAGTSRNLKPGESLAVRSAPFENSEGSGSVPAGARFFICTRSHD